MFVFFGVFRSAMTNVTAKLKALETQIKNVTKTLQKLQSERAKTDSEIAKINKQLLNLNKEKQQLLQNDKPVIVSEHAVIRYLERVKGIDIEAIKKTILNKETEQKLKILGQCIYPCDGYKLVFKDNTIVTVEL